MPCIRPCFLLFFFSHITIPAFTFWNDLSPHHAHCVHDMYSISSFSTFLGYVSIYEIFDQRPSFYATIGYT